MMIGVATPQAGELYKVKWDRLGASHGPWTIHRKWRRLILQPENYIMVVNAELDDKVRNREMFIVTFIYEDQICDGIGFLLGAWVEMFEKAK